MMRNYFASGASNRGGPGSTDAAVFRRCLGFAVACLFIVLPGVQAQEPKNGGKEPPDPEIHVIPFFDTSHGFEVRAAVTLAAEGDVWRALAVRMAISENVPAIPSWQFHFDRMLPLTQRYVDAIADGRRLPDVRGKQLKSLPPADRGLYVAYLEAIVRSHKGDLELFKRSSEPNEKVVYPHLKQNPRRYRGRVVPVSGKVTAVRLNDAPPALREFEGIQTTYFAWITTPTRGAPPYGVIFTQLPDELKALKSLEGLDLEVTFHGYFIAHVLIPAEMEQGIEKKRFTAPWLVGKTLIVHPKAAPVPAENSPYSYFLIVTTLGGIILVAILVAILIAWHRGGDARTQAKLESVRDKNQPFTIQPADEEPPPVVDGWPAGSDPKEPPAA